jgi:hypothetical protein
MWCLSKLNQELFRYYLIGFSRNKHRYNHSCMKVKQVPKNLFRQYVIFVVVEIIKDLQRIYTQSNVWIDQFNVIAVD